MSAPEIPEKPQILPEMTRTLELPTLGRHRRINPEVKRLFRALNALGYHVGIQEEIHLRRTLSTIVLETQKGQPYRFKNASDQARLNAILIAKRTSLTQFLKEFLKGKPS